MKKLLLLAVSALTLVCSQAQTVNFGNYQPLICQGKLPDDFKVELSKLVERVKQDKSNPSELRKEQEIEYTELSSHQLRNMLFSGKVLYGDMLTNYVNKVADKALLKEPELRKKLRFYVLKSTELNAYSTQRGIVFISIGLLAQIETEAQLAFIICHEAVHFRNNHNLEAYRKQEATFGKRDAFDNLGLIEQMLDYSKEHELEADREGLELFLASPYNTKELNKLFDVMLYSYLPFDEIPFDTTYFTSGKYVLPSSYFLKKIHEITAEENVPDSMSTHPNIRKRRENIQKAMKDRHKDEGVSFAYTREEFELVRKVARYEMAIAYVQSGEPEAAFYTAYLIEKTYGKSLFTEKIVCGSLYLLAKQKLHTDRKVHAIGRLKARSHDDAEYASWKDVEGESQAIYHLFYKLPAKEAAILAAREMLRSNAEYPDNFFLHRYKDLICELAIDYGVSMTYFIKPANADTAKELYDTSSLSKVDKIKRNRQAKSEAPGETRDAKYFKYAFYEYYEDTAFKNGFYDCEEKSRKKKAFETSAAYMDYTFAKEKLVEKYGNELGIDKFIMMSPYYSRYVLRTFMYGYNWGVYREKDPKLTPLKEEEIEAHLVEYILHASESLGLQTEMTGRSEQARMETEQFNNFQALMNWFGERVDIGEAAMYPYNHEEIKPLADSYGHLGFMSVINIYKKMWVVMVMYDLHTGEMVFDYEKEKRKARPESKKTKRIIQDMLKQVKQKPVRLNALKVKYGYEQ